MLMPQRKLINFYPSTKNFELKCQVLNMRLSCLFSLRRQSIRNHFEALWIIKKLNILMHFHAYTIRNDKFMRSSVIIAQSHWFIRAICYLLCCYKIVIATTINLNGDSIFSVNFITSESSFTLAGNDENFLSTLA